MQRREQLTSRYRSLIWGLALLLGVCVLPATALAHAHLVRADLAPDSHLQVPAGTVRFWFDEALNSALSRIIIRNAQGQQVNTDTGRVNPTNAEEVDLQIPALPNGQYSVFWTSDSAQDGHVLHGFYVFTVGGPGATAISAAPTAIANVDQPELDPTSLASALAHWLVLAASALWTGALALEVLVLAPARARPFGGLATLCRDASTRIGIVVRAGLIATLATSLLELGTQAYAAGGWSGVTSASVLDDVLSSHYGTFWIVRVLASVLAVLVLGGTGIGQRAETPDRQAGGARSARPLSRAIAWSAGLLGLLYLLALALSGHAASVSRLVFTSVMLDWLHLLASTVWVGGMVAIALALVPALLRYPVATPTAVQERRAAFLTVLDRFSPAALLAVATAAFTGMFNAQVHLSNLDQLIDTAYGRFLLIKLALIAEIMLLSASHVFITRPRLRGLLTADGTSTGLDDGFSSLIVRLRVEPLLGMLILLCVAMMGQVAPAVTVFTDVTPTSASAPAATPTPAAPRTISGTVHKGLLDVTLTIDPAAVGRARFFAAVRERGKAVADGQVRIKLSMPASPSLGAVFVETTPVDGGYRGSGDLVSAGRWRADVLVRTRSDPLEFRDVPFDFLAGPDAAFLLAPPVNSRYGPATVRLTQPSNAPATLEVQLRPGLQVRYEVLMLGMPGMGSSDYPATATTGGWYRGQIIFPMAGITRVAIQVQDRGGWQLARLLIYDVDNAGAAHLLAAGASPTPSASTSQPAAKNLAFALHLPYTTLVTRMRNNTVARIDGTSVHTGTMPHGVDFVDGTHLAYVTDFLSGDVVILDTQTLKILHRIPVGLEPAHVVFTPDHRLAFATNFLTNDVSVIDMRTAGVVGDIQVGLRPHGLDVSPDGHTLYVACEGAGAVYVIDTRSLKVVTEAPAGLAPIGVTVNPANGEINVTDARGNLVSILEPGSLRQRAQIAVGQSPALMAISDDGSRLYVANQVGNSVSVIDTRRARVVATVPVGNGPHGLDLTPDGKYVYVASINAGTISIIRTSDNTVVAVVPIGQGPNEVAILH